MQNQDNGEYICQGGLPKSTLWLYKMALKPKYRSHGVRRKCAFLEILWVCNRFVAMDTKERYPFGH